MTRKNDLQVEEALFKRAVGYSQITDKPIKLKRIEYSESGKKILEEEFVEIHSEVTEVLPSISAIGMYLKNRMPNKWGNATEVEETKIQLEVID